MNNTNQKTELEWLRVIAEYFRTVDKSTFSPKLLNAIDSLNWYFYDEKGKP